MKTKNHIFLFLLFFLFSFNLIAKKEPPTSKISLHFLKKYINIQLKGKYFVSYLSKTDYSFQGIIQEIKTKRGFPFFIKFIKDPEKEKNKKYKYKFNDFPADKKEDGTIIVKISDNIIVGVGRPLKGFGNPIDILKMLDLKTAIEKAGK